VKVPQVTWMKLLLVINGGFFLLRGALDIVQPTSFYLAPDAPGYAVDAVRVLGITYLALGLIQLGSWVVNDRRAVRLVASASVLFAAGVFLEALSQGSGSADQFHRLAPGPAVENLLVAAAYVALLLRDVRAERPTHPSWQAGP